MLGQQRPSGGNSVDPPLAGLTPIGEIANVLGRPLIGLEAAETQPRLRDDATGQIKGRGPRLNAGPEPPECSSTSTASSASKRRAAAP